MIKLTRPPCPSELTDQVKQIATAEFRATGNAVWNKEYIRSSLRVMSGRKCAFCECRLEEESKYLEVEHFAHKSGHPDLVMEWTNLLPACRRCNGSKGAHDVIQHPIVNPAAEDPRDFLELRCYRFVGRDAAGKGRTTVDVLNLNESDRLTLCRFQIGDAVLTQLDEVADKLRSFITSRIDVRAKNRVLSQLRNLLLEAQPSAEYAGTVATVITSSSDYSFVKSELVSQGLWSGELEQLDKSMHAIVYR